MIFDCFPFHNELELLKIRLEELQDTVDWFVLVEAEETFSGLPKPRFYEENRHLFDAYNIVCVEIKDFPPLDSPWQRMEYTRDILSRGLEQLKPSPQDIILLSNVDEIPRAERIREYSEVLRRGECRCCMFQQHLYCYYLNYHVDTTWHGTRMMLYENVFSFQGLRTTMGHIVPDGGWHFRYIGGAQKVLEKIEASAHPERNTSTHRNLAYVTECIRQRKSIWGEPLPISIESLSETLPRYLYDNQQQFAHMIQTDVENAVSLPDIGSTRNTNTASRPPFPHRRNEQMKATLWEWWGHPNHPAEWDGRYYGGGKGSQRFWEYLWMIHNLPECRRILDVGSGNTLFWADLLSTQVHEVWALDPLIPPERRNIYFRAESLEEFLTNINVCPPFDVVTCVSVLEHVTDRPRFCQYLDSINAPILMTFELTYRGEMVTLQSVYECLAQFQSHYVSKMEVCPVWADNSSYGMWRPMGVLLNAKEW